MVPETVWNSYSAVEILWCISFCY